MKKILYLILVFLLILVLTPSVKVFAFWNEFISQPCSQTLLIRVDNFGYISSPCSLATLIIDDEFYYQYMVLQNDSYTWKTDEYNNVINANQIRSLTPITTIIKSDICYEVISSNYNLIDHGLPNKQSPLSWALRPIILDYVEGWAYSQNRVVKADGQFFFARFYTTENPTINRRGWDKIEPMQATDFNFFNNSNVPNYSNPKFTKVVRSYLYDSYTNYLVGDIVLYNSVEYEAIQNSMGFNPQSYLWAWKMIWSK